MSNAISTRIEPLFATPLGVFTLPDFERVNAGLKGEILEREQADRGVGRSNVGGWHSGYDLLSWPIPEVAELGKAVQQAALTLATKIVGANQIQAKMAMEGWANVSRAGNYNKLHYHPNWHLSVVYYVEAGDPPPSDNPESGCLEFTDPRGAVGMFGLDGSDFGKTYRIPAKTGRLLVFPSFLQHWVHPYLGSGERISLAINVRLRDIERLR
jgi:uncharacterized protein (TIGR02466 family)